MEDGTVDRADDLFALSEDLVAMAGRLMRMAQELHRLADRMKADGRPCDEASMEVGTLV